MSKTHKLPDGVLTASLTPLNADLNPDYPSIVKHVKWLLDRGNNGIALLGTTGEANSFSVDERMRILEAVLAAGIPAHKLLVGSGCCSMTDTIALTRHAQSHSVGGILLLPPFYYKQISDDGVVAYLSAVLDKTSDNEIEIYLYHFPQLSGVPFSATLTERLVALYPDQIVGMKDSGGDWSHMEEVLNLLPGFRLFAGNEKFLLPVLKAGGVGCISASANLTSPEAAAVYEAWKRGSGEEEQIRVTALREVLETYPAIGTLKYVFAKLSGNRDWLNIRPPNVIIADNKGQDIEEKLKALEAWNEF